MSDTFVVLLPRERQIGFNSKQGHIVTKIVLIWHSFSALGIFKFQSILCINNNDNNVKNQNKTNIRIKHACHVWSNLDTVEVFPCLSLVFLGALVLCRPLSANTVY